MDKDTNLKREHGVTIDTDAIIDVLNACIIKNEYVITISKGADSETVVADGNAPPIDGMFMLMGAYVKYICSSAKLLHADIADFADTILTETGDDIRRYWSEYCENK